MKLHICLDNAWRNILIVLDFALHGVIRMFLFALPVAQVPLPDAVSDTGPTPAPPQPAPQIQHQVCVCVCVCPFALWPTFSAYFARTRTRRMQNLLRRSLKQKTKHRKRRSHHLLRKKVSTGWWFSIFYSRILTEWNCWGRYNITSKFELTARSSFMTSVCAFFLKWLNLSSVRSASFSPHYATWVDRLMQ